MGRDPREEFYNNRREQLQQRFPKIDCQRSRTLLGLLHTHDVLQEILELKLRPFGLSSSAFNLLNILEHSEPECLPLHEISRLMVTSRANISGLVDSLVKRQLVSRTSHPQDRRVKLCQLTSQGKELLNQAFPSQIQWLEELTQAFSQSELEQFGTFLARLRAALADLSSPSA